MSTTLLLAIRCACGTRPNWRTTPEERDRYVQEEDGKVVGSWQCQRCLAKHEVTAGAYKHAVPTAKGAA